MEGAHASKTLHECCMLLLAKPGKPSSLEITKMTGKTASLHWKRPANDGGADIFNYIIEYRAEGAFKWLRANEDNMPAMEYTVKGLKPDTIYEFRVSAENKAGVGPASEPTMPTKIIEPVGE